MPPSAPFVVLRSPSGVPPLGSRSPYLMLPSVRLLVFLCFCCAPLCVWVGPAFLSGCVALVGSSPCLLLLPLPRGWSRVAPWSSFYAGTSLWVSGCSCDGSVALLSVGSVVVLCCPSVNCLMATKAIKPCVGCLHPLHHVAGDVKVLSLATLRYSS